MRVSEVVVGPSAPARQWGSARSLLVRAAWAGMLVHAAFLPISIAGMQIGLGIAAASVTALWAIGERPVVARLAVPVLLLAGAAAVSVALAWSVGMPPTSFSKTVQWRHLLAPLVVALALEAGIEGNPGGPRRRAVVALVMWSAAALVPALFAWIQVRTGTDPMHALGFRRNPLPPPHRVPFAPGAPERFAVIGFFSWYTRLAHALTPVAVLAASLAACAALARRTRAFLAFVAVASSAAVLLTGARAAWAGLVVAAALLAALAVPRKVRRAGLAVSVAAALAISPLLPGAWEWLEETRTAAGGNGRVLIWSVCADVIRDHPLTGVGYGALPRWSARYWERRDPDFGVQAWCHDAFLTAVAEGGPLLGGAMVAWFALLALAFVRWGRGADALGRAGAAGGLAVLAALLVNSLVHDVFWTAEPALAFGCAIGIAAVLARGRDPVDAPSGKIGDSQA